MIRTVIVLLCCAAVVTACQQAVDGQPIARSAADVSILSQSVVEELSGIEDLSREVDTDQPISDTYLADGACRGVADQRAAFGNAWTSFRSVADTVPIRPDMPLAAMVSLVQNVVVYPDGAAARTVFDSYVPLMVQCADSGTLGLEGNVERRDDGTAVWVTEGMASVFAIEGSILVGTSAVAVPDAERVAIKMTRAILDRIG
ncbi:sensor domain-containing protein [Mycolicibacterium sp. A43C]